MMKVHSRMKVDQCIMVPVVATCETFASTSFNCSYKTTVFFEVNHVISTRWQFKIWINVLEKLAKYFDSVNLAGIMSHIHKAVTNNKMFKYNQPLTMPLK